MSDAAQEPDGQPPARERSGSRLPSARDVATPEPRARAPHPGGRKGRGGRGRGGAAGSKPTPARSLGRSDATPSVEPDVEEAAVAVDGVAWIVRVLGRSEGGGRGRGTPLLLLGFTPCDATEAAARREALVVGRTLGALSEMDLEAAFARSRPAPGDEAQPGGRSD